MKGLTITSSGNVEIRGKETIVISRRNNVSIDYLNAILAWQGHKLSINNKE